MIVILGLDPGIHHYRGHALDYPIKPDNDGKVQLRHYRTGEPSSPIKPSSSGSTRKSIYTETVFWITQSSPVMTLIEALNNPSSSGLTWGSIISAVQVFHLTLPTAGIPTKLTKQNQIKKTSVNKSY
jgi:hypothetical protein